MMHGQTQIKFIIMMFGYIQVTASAHERRSALYSIVLVELSIKLHSSAGIVLCFGINRCASIIKKNVPNHLW